MDKENTEEGEQVRRKGKIRERKGMSEENRQEGKQLGSNRWNEKGNQERKSKCGMRNVG